jgi:predicted AlkP superfamily pyrophosphatase or phosphodiesterase
LSGKFINASRLAARAMLLLLTLILAGGPISPALADVPRPKLVLMLVADQFTFDYLQRFHDLYGTTGLRMLQDKGAFFCDCRYASATSQTAVGHSIIATGAYPWSTGIVADHWFDPGHNKTVNATMDDAAQMVGANGSGASAKLMEGTTFGDEMRLSSNGKCKVISVALKPEASLLMGGRSANSVFWWDTHSGAFVSSSQYGRELPGWAKTFNDQHYADKYVAKPWQRLLPESQYSPSTSDDYAYERSIPSDGRQFPHIVGGTPGEPFYSAFSMTPWANEMLVDFGKSAIDNESLGQRGETDLLAISFSAGETLGQSFGPYSQEMQDLCLRLDQSLGNLLLYVDQKVGLNNCLIVFTADHGVSPIPEHLNERGIEGGRIDPKVFKTLVNSALSSRLGPGDWIAAFEPPNLYLNANTISKNKYRQPDVEAIAAKLVHSVAGVAEAYSAFQFYTNQLPSGPLLESVRKSYFWGRSGELYIVPKAGFIFDSEINGTQSGSPYNYDCHVPLMIMGSSIQPGRYGRQVSPADIAPTLSAILGIDSPSLCEGHPISECLQTK